MKFPHLFLRPEIIITFLWGWEWSGGQVRHRSPRNSGSVIRTSDLINQSGELSVIAPTSIPDHSLLKWKIEIQNVPNVANSCPNASEHAYPEQTNDDSIKFDVTSISSQFLGDYLVLQQVNETISKLESSMRSQSDIDCIYTGWCNILKQHMLQNLTHTKRHKNSNNGVYSKKHRPGKPWWSEKLSQLHGP